MLFTQFPKLFKLEKWQFLPKELHYAIVILNVSNVFNSLLLFATVLYKKFWYTKFKNCVSKIHKKLAVSQASVLRLLLWNIMYDKAVRLKLKSDARENDIALAIIIIWRWLTSVRFDISKPASECGISYLLRV